MSPEFGGGGLNSHRSPPATVSRDETCHVSCAHSEYSVSSTDWLISGPCDLQRSPIFERPVALSAITPIASAASRRIAVTWRKSTPNPSEWLPSRKLAVSTVWN